ncbi:hypothetical protein [Paraflavitalea speifideaquila]|uniref:hypothetical protein n=1 Tax=Paraflavitalea speifideaquila TaxID=3076558 RepID=UPI0028E5FF67|nr:hypothetical protein [Paraflavitalea speifideiaquila]
MRFAMLPAFALTAIGGLSSFQDETVGVIEVEAPAKYVCTVSSDASKNTGKCRALSSGNGDMCFTSGTGTACSGDATVTPAPAPTQP